MALAGGGSGGAAVRAGRAFVEFFLKDEGFQRSLDRIRGRLTRFGTIAAGVGAGVTAAGAAVLAPVTKLFTSAVTDAAIIGRFAAKIGDTAENVSRLAYAAETTGVTFDDLRGHFENWVERVKQGAQGAGEAADEFRRLNLDANELMKLPVTEQFVALSKAMQGVTNETQRLGMLSSFGGDKFQELNAFLKLGPEGIRRAMDEADRVGATTSQEQVRQALEVQRAWLEMTTAVKQAFLEVGRALFGQVDNIRALADLIVGAAAAAREFIARNRTLVLVVTAVAAAVAAVGVALGAVGAAAIFASAAVSALGTILGAVFSPVGAVVLGVAAAVAVLAAAVAGLGYLFVTQTQTGAAAFDFLKGVVRDVADNFSKAWSGIAAAVRAGNFKLALQIAGAAGMVEWKRLMLGLTVAWVGFKDLVVDGWHSVINELMKAMADFVNWMGRQWAKVGVEGMGMGTTAEEIQARFERDRKARDEFRRGQIDEARADIRAAERRRDELVAQAQGAARPKPGAAEQGIRDGVRAAREFGKSAGAFGGFVGGRQFGRSFDDLQRRQLAQQTKTADNTEAIYDFFRRGGAALVWQA